MLQIVHTVDSLEFWRGFEFCRCLPALLYGLKTLTRYSKESGYILPVTAPSRSGLVRLTPKPFGAMQESRFHQESTKRKRPQFVGEDARRAAHEGHLQTKNLDPLLFFHPCPNVVNLPKNIPSKRLRTVLLLYGSLAPCPLTLIARSAFQVSDGLTERRSYSRKRTDGERHGRWRHPL
jgi:hypothetical protein